MATLFIETLYRCFYARLPLYATKKIEKSKRADFQTPASCPRRFLRVNDPQKRGIRAAADASVEPELRSSF